MKDLFSLQWQPKGVYPTIRVYIRKWFVHPTRRRIARWWLIILKRFFGLRVIAITGSAGKTTTKEMIQTVLSQRYKTISTDENIDPVFNIPTTILRARPATRVLVLEMGIEFPGEMDFYLWLAQPDVAVLTNLYFTHTEFLGDVEGVTREKAKLLKGLDDTGTTVLNADDARVLAQKAITHGRLILYGLDKKADVKAKNVKLDKELRTEFTLEIGRESVEVRLPTLGEQNVSNALAAAAVAWSLSLPLPLIKQGIGKFSPAPHRLRPIKTKSGAWIIDDTYNSNPLAAKESLRVLSKIPAKERIAVLGEMRELGDYEKMGHREVGEFARRLGIREVVGLGDAARALGTGQGVYSNKEAVEYIKPRLKAGVVVLIKGSRALRMEEIVSSLVS